MIRTLLSTALIALGATATTAVTPTTAKAECGEVTISQMDWASGLVVTAVSKFLMEQGYGCKVTTVPTATVPAITSVAETGKPDIVTELWVNSVQVPYQKLTDEGKIVTLGDVLSDGGVESWLIPTYVAEAHPELKTIEDIKANPGLVGGKFHNCPVGWACRKINDNLIKAHGLRDVEGLEIFDHGSGETLATAIAAAYADKAPWFGYYWAPTAILGKYPMATVDIGEYNADIHKCNTEDTCATPGKSAYPAGKVITISTTAFQQANPDVAELMSNVAFSNKEMGEVLAWQTDNKASPDEAAVYFLTNYKDTWGGWLNEAATKKLGALLNN